MPDSDIAEHKKALRVWERMLALEMDHIQRSNVLRRIGDSCLEIIERKNDAEICRRAADAYSQALQFYTPERFPAARARVLRGLGYAYSRLADLAERQSSLSRAISCWEEALSFFAASAYAEEHACLHNELSGAYRKLAEVESRRDNGKRAVQSALAALELFSPRYRPLDYAAAKANLGAAYLILAQAAGYAADQADGCKKAILAYQEAMEVYSQDRYPQKYAAMKNNLAIAYLTLSQVEEREDNCRKALLACQEALSYHRREEQPLAYAALQNNLGNAYIALAEEEEAKEDALMAEAADNRNAANKSGENPGGCRAAERGRLKTVYECGGARTGGNGGHGDDRCDAAEAVRARAEGEVVQDEDDFLVLCSLAMQAYSQAARIYFKEGQPWLYATAQNNLAAVYLALGRREDPVGNSMKAVKAAEEALSFFTLENSPQDYAEGHGSLWMAHLILADIEYREENCSAALEAIEERLKATREFGQPVHLAGCYKDLAITACMLAEVEVSAQARIEDCRKAIDAGLEALRIYRVQSYPAEYAETQTLLWAAYSALSEVEDAEENLKSAIQACRAAIRVYETINPGERAYAQKNLSHSFISLAELEDRAENSRNAIEACEAALEYYTAEKEPLEYADIMKALAYAYVTLSGAGEEEKGSVEWLKKAMKAYKRALRIYQAEESALEKRGDPQAHEARENAERCQRSLQSCKALLRARRRGGEIGRHKEKKE